MKRVKVIINYFCFILGKKLSTIFSYLFTNFCWACAIHNTKSYCFGSLATVSIRLCYIFYLTGSLNTLCAIVLWKLPPLRNTSISASSFAKTAATYTSAVVKSIATILWPECFDTSLYSRIISGNCCMFNLPEELRRPLVVPCRLKPVRR